MSAKLEGQKLRVTFYSQCFLAVFAAFAGLVGWLFSSLPKNAGTVELVAAQIWALAVGVVAMVFLVALMVFFFVEILRLVRIIENE